MSNHARIEGIEDSDPDEMDISSVVPHGSNATQSQSFINPSSIPAASSQPRKPDPEQTKSWQCLYPVYLDASRSRDEGRRVSKKLAVLNPLAREVLDAVCELGFKFDFEIEKTHPKDWSNPGRVRVLLKQDGQPVHHSIKNSQ